MRHEVIDGLLEDEPELAADIVLGIEATGHLEGLLADHVGGVAHGPHRAPHTSGILRRLRLRTALFRFGAVDELVRCLR
ncbi:hypothetical protein [Streptomyces sp. NPDC048142]|uniref:hypothetical protein n=1 Tax=Streptomyces sp. NPDC048142 TaxID=3365501 RepID=UPI00371E51F2